MPTIETVCDFSSAFSYTPELGLFADDTQNHGHFTSAEINESIATLQNSA